MIALMGTVYGMEDFHKHSIKCNMLHLYDEVPGDPLVNGTIIKSDPSYDEARFEINYLF